MKFLSLKQRLAIAAVVTLLILFLLRPGISPLKVRIANSISRAVARPVEIGAVHLRFLPPGFDLHNLVIGEDPAFGAEPMLRAPDVSAGLRFSALLRGRLEIARLELSEPSLNLVRRADGQWNWEALLERSAQTPLAPTAKTKSGTGPGFPYLEANSGRINFKAGPEKKPYALLNADFAVWQESEDAWGVRLSAQPLRTDMSLSDSGRLRMNGIWQRAGSVRETPLQVSLEWDRAQLGQMTKLLSGVDKGWRGEVRLDGTISGTPAALAITMNAAVDDFRRYDIPNGESLRLAAHCEGRYSSEESFIRDVLCTAPVGEGLMTLRGETGLPGARRADLSLELENVPVRSVARLASHAKKNFPAGLLAAGNVQGNFAIRENPSYPEPTAIEGSGKITDLRLDSSDSRAELMPPPSIPFVLTSQATRAKKPVDILRSEEVAADQFHLEYGPFSLPLGRPSPVQVRGWMGRSGYSLSVRGEGDVPRTLRLASLLGLPVMKANVEGTAQMDLQVSRNWAASEPDSAPGAMLPALTGTAQLRNIRAVVRGVSRPVEISSAEVRLMPDGVRVERLNAQAAGTRWMGTLAFPRGCGTPGACLVHFRLSTDEVELQALREWFGPPTRERRWYQMLSASAPAATFLDNLRATGKLSANRLQIRGMVADRVAASVDIERGKLRISDLRANFMGGKQRGDWEADFTGDSPVYAGSGTFTAVSLGQVSDAMYDPWISGTADGSYQIRGSGTDSAEFWKSAEGAVQMELLDGTLPHISLNDEGPVHLSHWQGQLQLRDGKIAIESEKSTGAAGSFEIEGTASLGRELDLKLVRTSGSKLAGAGTQIYTVTGTVAEPHVTLTPETQAQLKP